MLKTEIITIILWIISILWIIIEPFLWFVSMILSIIAIILSDRIRKTRGNMFLIISIIVLVFVLAYNWISAYLFASQFYIL